MKHALAFLIAFCFSLSVAAGPVATPSTTDLMLPDYSVAANNLSSGSFSVTNTGDAPLHVIVAGYLPMPLSTYQRLGMTYVQNCTNAILAPGNSCTVTVTLASSFLGLHTRPIFVYTNGGNLSVAVSGNVVP